MKVKIQKPNAALMVAFEIWKTDCEWAKDDGLPSPSSTWTLDGDVLTIEGPRHSVTTYLYGAWCRNGGARDADEAKRARLFRGWRRGNFGDLKVAEYQSQEPSWAWYENRDDHVVDIWEPLALEARRAILGKPSTRSAAEIEHDMIMLTTSAYWRLLDAPSRAIVSAICCAGDPDPEWIDGRPRRIDLESALREVLERLKAL